MIAVVSDTHRETDHGLRGSVLETVGEADLVCHAGDFTTAAVYESFRETATRLEAVYGNSDPSELRDRLPSKRVFVHEGVRIVVVHGHEHSGTALSLLARQEGADVLISGHSHAPGVRVGEGIVLLDPGSHADPRGSRAAYAELDVSGSTIEGRLVETNGTVFERFSA